MCQTVRKPAISRKYYTAMMKVSPCMRQALRMSFSGSGFLMVYQLGACACLIKNGQKCLREVKQFAGTSGGALVATLLAVAPNHLQTSLARIYELADRVRRKPLRALTPGFSLTQEVRHHLEDLLPHNAHVLATNRVFVSVTRLPYLENRLLSKYNTRAEFIQSLICSCFIPVYDGVTLPSLHNMTLVDGCYTLNLPRFPEGRTIVVTPFSGELDISPAVPSGRSALSVRFKHQQFHLTSSNARRLIMAVFPPPLNILQAIYHNGYDDCLKFLNKESWLVHK